MTILPFCGTIFNPERFPNLTDILAPPYDVITPEERRFLQGRSRLNTVRLILGEKKDGECFEDEFYTAARALLEKWIQSGDLIHMEQPGIFYLNQFFEGPDGEDHLRKGFIALMSIEEYGPDTVRAHERTMQGPIHDRMRLTETTRTNFSQIFFTYQDEHNRIIKLLDEAISGARLKMEGEDLAGGVQNSCYLIQDEEVITEIQDLMEMEPVFIADGHHRYETMRQYREQRILESGLNETDASYIMGYFACAQDPGLQIYPTHRTLPAGKGFDFQQIVEGCRAYFDILVCDREDLELGTDHRSFTLAGPGGELLELTLKDEAYLKLKHDLADPLLAEMDTVILEEIILKQVLHLETAKIQSHGFLGFHHDLDEFWAAMDSGAGAGWILNYPNAQVVFELAGRGQRLPQKTTYFYPKLPTGFVFRHMED